jgi:sugar phosphate isomerase/epimerase
MKIGCHVVQWGIAINEKERRTWDGKVWNRDLISVLEKISRAGYEGFDSSEEDLSIYFRPAARKKLVMAMEKNNLEIASTWSTILPKKFKRSEERPKLNVRYPMDDPRQFRPMCISEIGEGELKKYFVYALKLAKFLHQSGASVLTLGGPFIVKENVRESHYRILGETLESFGEKCNQIGIHLAYHPHLSTIVENSKDLEKLLDHVDRKSLGICLDTAHLYVAGENLNDFIARFGSRINHAHLKDTKDGKFVELGTGLIDFRSVIRALENVGYSSWLIAELDVPKRSALASAYSNKSFLNQILEAQQNPTTRHL